MALAVFDLDNTLLAGDSDYLWGQYLCDRGVVDRARYEDENCRFYDDYTAGRLDIQAFLRFALRPLADNDPAMLETWRRHFVEERIEPIVTPASEALVASHRDAGDTLLIVTATNAFVTEPIAVRYGIPHLIATEPERIDGRFTGRVAGTPSFREGKVERIHAWLEAFLRAHGNDGECSPADWLLQHATFYSDSINDLPLLERVAGPVAVDPCPRLRETATERDWPIISLRD